MNIYTSIVIFLLMVLAALASIALKPDFELKAKEIPAFKEIIPISFSGWEMIVHDYQQISLSVEDERNIDQPYDAILMETFQNSSKETIMLAVAYGANQQQEIKIHRPELCYPAQGFQVEEINDLEYEVDVNNKIYRFNLTQMVSKSRQRREVTLYWIRIGNMISSNPWKIRWNILKGGLSQDIPDGILVRTSQVLSKNLSVEQAIKMQKEFIQNLLTGIHEKESSNLTLFIPNGASNYAR